MWVNPNLSHANRDDVLPMFYRCFVEMCSRKKKTSPRFADSDSDLNRSDWLSESAPIHTPSFYPFYYYSTVQETKSESLH